jgi:hypothetical protein
MPKVPAYPPGTTINGRYELGVKLGSDGSVYQAHDRHLDTTAALKILHPIGGTAQSWDEAKRLEHLRSRFLVDVINADVITSSDLRFIVTPLLTGGDLENAAKGVGLCVRDAVRFSQQISTGVARIHAAGMVHRDIKPANVLLQGDEALVSGSRALLHPGCQRCCTPGRQLVHTRAGDGRERWSLLTQERRLFIGCNSLLSAQRAISRRPHPGTRDTAEADRGWEGP